MRLMLLCGVLFAMAAGASEPVASPEPETRRTFMGLALVPAAQGVVALDLERRLSPKLSWWLEGQLSVGLLGNDEFVKPAFAAQWLVGAQPGLRYYLTGTALNGLWVGPRLELGTQWSDIASHLNLSWGAGVAALVGYSLQVSEGLTVQAGVGLGATYSSDAKTMVILSPTGSFEESISHVHSWGVSDRVTLAVGWAL